MAEFLVFTLAGAMGSFGDLAGHERRGSQLWPGRSAVLGLIGAALGVRREDAAGQAALADWRMAVGTLSLGAPFRDFHTAQAVPTARIKRPNARRHALAALKPSDNPVLTLRDYVTDCAFAVALWGGDGPVLAEALAAPYFTPYLGRKACPLTVPMAPRLVEAETPVAALSHAVRPRWAETAQVGAVACDNYPGVSGLRETRWDDPADRASWSFRSRSVIHLEGGT
ncbi:type I-E CRISPR-associated protein Cas5/CasD [Defluviimonas sp. SAOS-178_SWC]|uniref:type I-E CRISPR-associated protein Cas5/CasD n=1 Tax=Defluviimonas sp. SAOS-178_SWC TaxID=3121287 RepID=UPI00322209B6